ncbi:substrate-binding domain-containing protein [Limosilactobacillus reuteri]|uniref:substrate-binding domain-containing protein n=1 Tax=Limosilactobacillus reuteri TaxID=1598 RepID=UPI00226CD32F|nr:substrate-binding domain-containing protein [Limosilactobacillus reuteri]
MAGRFSYELAQRSGKTAVISLMGPVLFDLLTIFQQRQLTFPDDFGLVSFDDWEWSQFVGRGIYLLKQNVELMGNLAAQRLLQQIEHHHLAGSTTLLPVEIVDLSSL